MITFFTLKFSICFLILLMFLFVDNNSSLNDFLFLFKIFKVVIPIEPVEPKIPIFFSFYKHYKDK